jgi:hypothetical protein
VLTKIEINLIDPKKIPFETFFVTSSPGSGEALRRRRSFGASGKNCSLE